MTRRAAPGSRTEGADEPPEAADPETGTEAVADVQAADQPAEQPVEPAEAETEPEPETETEPEPEAETEPAEAEEPPPIPREPALVGALRRVRAELAAIRFPLALPDAGTAAESARTLATQLDDYLLPRLARLDAPLLVVVGGSTGAGKSTLVNSLVRAPVSPAGVLRPTTRAPVLVSAPGDNRWFLGPPDTGTDADLYLLPHLVRTTGLDAVPGALRVISAPGLRRGLALLDAPDLDSVVAANRALADQVHRSADLWLCVTTAARYADAVPWASLRGARDRGTRLALLLNRVPVGADEEILGHLGELLEAEGLAGIQLFVLPEVVLDGQGLLSEAEVAPIAAWLEDLAADPATRVRVVGDTLGGALAALRWGVEELAESAERQHAAATALREVVDDTYAAALSTVERALADGTLLRGEVLVRWRQFVDDGGLRGPGGLWFRRAFGRPVPGSGRLLAALEAALVTLLVETRAEADDRVRTAWSTDPAGAALLPQGNGAPARAARTDQVRAMVRDWLARVREAADEEPVALLVVLRILAGELPLEPREQNRVRAVLAKTALVETGRAELLARVGAVLDADAAAFTTLLADADDAAATAERLRAAVSTGETE